MPFAVSWARLFVTEFTRTVRPRAGDTSLPVGSGVAAGHCVAVFARPCRHVKSQTDEPIMKTAIARPRSTRATPEEIVMSAACSVLGDLAVALTWLSQANAALGGESPLQRVRRQHDVSQVLVVLGRIDRGVYS